MSYEIVYSRNFIKTSRGIIPLTLSGSNNCTEFRNGRERREHNWSCLYFKTDIYTEEEIMNKIKSYCGGDYQEHFKLNGKWVDDKGLVRFYENGIKEARTLEDWFKNGLVYDSKYKYHLNNIKCYVDKYTRENGFSYSHLQYVSNEEDLLKWLDDVKADFKDEKDVWFRLDLGSCDKITYQKEVKAKEIKGKCVIKDNKKYYLTNDKFYWNKQLEKAMIFDNQEEAKKMLDELRNNHYNTLKFKILSYDKEVKTKESKNVVIKFDNGYYVRKAKYGFRYCSYMCSSVMKTTKEKAIKIMEDLKRLYNKYNFEVVEVV